MVTRKPISPSRRGAPRRIRLSDGFLPLLGALSRPRRLYFRPVRRKLHRRPRSTLSSICQDIPANNCNELYGFPHFARVGRILSRRCFNKTWVPKLRGIRDSRMRNKRQPGPASGRCESRGLTRKARAELPSFWSQSMGSLSPSSKRGNLSFCACVSTRTNRRPFAAIRYLICRPPTISASALRAN